MKMRGAELSAPFLFFLLSGIRLTMVVAMIRVFVLGAAAILLCACSGSHPSNVHANDHVFYPAPPDPPRIQFLASFSNESQFGEETDGGILNAVLGEEEHSPEILRPYGLDVRKDKMILCDSRIDGLILCDFRTKRIEHFQPRGHGQMGTPVNCCFDSSGNIYVADTKRRQVVVFSPGMDFLRAIGDPENEKPVDVECVGDELLVLDMKKQCIHVYSLGDFSLLRSFPGHEGDNPANLYNPVNIGVGSNRLYVSDIGDSKVKVYDFEGGYLGSLGGLGTKFGNFVRPKGIAVDRDGNVFVVDAAFANIQVFNPDHKLLMFFGGSNNRSGDMYLPAGVCIDYDHTQYYAAQVASGYELEYLIFVTNQYGDHKVNVYGFIKPSVDS